MLEFLVGLLVLLGFVVVLCAIVYAVNKVFGLDDMDFAYIVVIGGGGLALGIGFMAYHVGLAILGG